MSFFRPEIKALFRRWGETLIMGTLAAILFGLALRGVMLRPPLITMVIAAIGAVALSLTWIAAQKARIRGGTSDPGVVRIEETRITYFGPLSGGVAHLPDIRTISVQKGPTGAFWMIAQPDVPIIAIPAEAAGADKLPEVFAALPGFWIGRAAQAFAAPGRHESVIWKRR